MQYIWRRSGSAVHILFPVLGKNKKKKVRTDNRCNESTVMSCAAVWRLSSVFSFFFPFGWEEDVYECFLLQKRCTVKVADSNKVTSGTASHFPQMHEHLSCLIKTLNSRLLLIIIIVLSRWLNLMFKSNHSNSEPCHCNSRQSPI